MIPDFPSILTWNDSQVTLDIYCLFTVFIVHLTDFQAIFISQF